MKSKTILARSSELLRQLNEENSLTFSLEKAYRLLNESSQPAVRRLLADMTTRGLLVRLKSGLYSVIPYDQNPDDYVPNWHLIAGNLAGEANFYIGYYSALELHSLITQPSFREQIVVDKQIKPTTQNILGHKFQFIYHNPQHFFGIKPIWVDSFNKVPCSDLEKTLVDSLYKPEYSGGITEIAKALFKSRENIDYNKLLDYCIKFNAQSVIKRLGLLLEMLKINHPILEQLQKRKTPSIVLLEPSYERTGKINTKWSVQQNITFEDITSPIFS